jgi:hypothetical protein
MVAAEKTLVLPFWVYLVVVTPTVLWAAWPEFVRPGIVSWRKRRRNARRIGI